MKWHGTVLLSSIHQNLCSSLGLYFGVVGLIFSLPISEITKTRLWVEMFPKTWHIAWVTLLAKVAINALDMVFAFSVS